MQMPPTAIAACLHHRNPIRASTATALCELGYISYNGNEVGHIATFCPQPDRRRQHVNFPNQCALCRQALHDRPCDTRYMARRSSNPPCTEPIKRSVRSTRSTQNWYQQCVGATKIGEHHGDFLMRTSKLSKRTARWCWVKTFNPTCCECGCDRRALVYAHLPGEENIILGAGGRTRSHCVGSAGHRCKPQSNLSTR